MELKSNQSALILTTEEDGETTVDVASGDIDGLTSQDGEAVMQTDGFTTIGESS